MVTWLLACAPEEPAPAAWEARVVTEPLPAHKLARRLSLDLRGVLPSAEELDAVERDPSTLDAYRDAWLADPRFEERLVQLLAERWHTRVDEHDILYFDYQLDSSQEYAFLRAVGEEPLRLAARIAVEDRPWTEIATADHTMADALLAGLWPLDYPDGAEGWQPARYTDGRPVSFTSSPSVLDADASDAAVQTEAGCLACHVAVDPLAAAYFGFYPTVPYNVKELDHYHPEREPDGPRLLGVSPAWFGIPVSGLAEVGAPVAADPRFDRCAAETAATLLWRRPVVLEDWGRADEPCLARERTRRLLSPDVLASSLEDLTGFRWEWQGWDQLANDVHGYRVMVGGVDGENVLEPQGGPGLTWALVTAGVAELAKGALVERHVGGGGAGTVLDGVTEDLAPGDPDFEAALDRLCWRLLAVRADAGRRAGLSGLWSEVAADDGAQAGSHAVLVTLFRDPESLAT